MENPHPVAVTARTATDAINLQMFHLSAGKPANAGFFVS
jgi:hypothetical protein